MTGNLLNLRQKIKRSVGYYYAKLGIALNKNNKNKTKLLIISTIIFVLFLVLASILAQKTVPNAKEYRFTQNHQLKFDGENLYIGDKLAINNISGVDKVRFGPDGRTLHFDTEDLKINTHTCVDLGGLIEPPNGFNIIINPPITNIPNTPWDFSTITYSNGVELRSCGWLKGGYVYKKDMFIYFKKTKDETPFLFIETINKKNEVTNTEKIQIKNIPEEFFHSDKYGNNKYEVRMIEGFDGSYYFYPKVNSKQVNNNLIVPFGNIIVVVDLVTQKVSGVIDLSDSTYGIVSDNYSIITNDLPVAYVESNWEGCLNPIALIDLNDVLQIINLNTLKIQSYCEVPHVGYVTSENSQTIFNVYTQPNVDNLIDVNYEEINKPGNEILRDSEEKRIETKIHNSLDVSYVKCEFGYGVGMGCHVLGTQDQYMYDSNGTLTKI